MPTYSGTFPLSAQGHPVTVTLDGVALTSPAPGNVGSTVRHGQLRYAYDYAAGDDDTTLLATVQTPLGLHTAYLEFDKTASDAASGGGGTTAETAKFIGTATGDTSGDEHTLTFAPDGPMPDGFSINEDGEILYTGLVIVETIDTRYTVRLDFTGATGFSNTVKPPDSDVTMYFASDVEDFGHNIAGPYVPALLDDPGPVFDLDAANKLVTQSKRTAGNLFLRLFGTINANGYDEAGEQVSDGVVTGALAVWITLATLPDSPDLPA